MSGLIMIQVVEKVIKIIFMIGSLCYWENLSID